MRSKKIGIIGHFGGDKPFFDGQTIKTKNLRNILQEQREESLFCVDTYLNNGHKVKLMLKTLQCLVSCKTVFILLSENGMKFYLPFLHYVNKVFRCRIFHYIIGSELLAMVEADPRLVKHLNAVEVNWFEYDSGTEFLQSKGVKNAVTLPNCKNLQAVQLDEIKPYTDDVLRFCTFSRVMPEKGITEAILTAAKINAQYGKQLVTVDIYGMVEPSYNETFEKLLEENPRAAAYRGAVDSRKSVEVLKDYFALLFPTSWPGEGFPGTILDTFASALPVIASDWNANKELLDHKRTGLLYPREGMENLEAAMLWAIENKAEMDAMRSACRQEYDQYTPEQIGAKICAAIDQK